MKRSTTGFTIVELLIVIVVIAVLAAITVIVYSNVQDRASISAGKSFDSSLRRNLSLVRAATLSFNEGSGSSSIDFSEETNNATITGSWATGMDGGYAIQANNNGTGAYIANNIYFGDKSFTLSAWVNSSDNDGTQGRVLGKEFYTPGPGGYVFINFGNGYPAIEARDSNNVYWSTGTGSNVTNISGKWTHLTAVIDREKGRSQLYINGKLERQSGVISSTGIFGDTTSTRTFNIGFQAGTSSALSISGIIDDVYIYRSSLSLSAIKQLYQEGADRIALH